MVRLTDLDTPVVCEPRQGETFEFHCPPTPAVVFTTGVGQGRCTCGPEMRPGAYDPKCPIDGECESQFGDIVAGLGFTDSDIDEVAYFEVVLEDGSQVTVDSENVELREVA